MARDLSVPPLKIGDVVYRSYSPQKIGKVVDLGETERYLIYRGNGTRYSQRAKVVWMTKTPTVEWFEATHLELLGDLVADHEKKLMGHRQRLLAATRWVPPKG